MLHAIKRRATFANVVAVIALFVALGGSAIAAGHFPGKTIKKNSEPGNRIKKNTITGKQVNEDTLGPVPKAKALVAAGGGTVGTAFARINADGTVDAANSSGISQGDLTKGLAGFYCFKSAKPKNVQVTNTSGTVNTYPEVILNGSAIPTIICPAGTSWGVIMKDQDSNSSTATPFDIRIIP